MEFIPVITKVQRFLFGWIPFSIGDLFYGFLILVVIFRTFPVFQTFFQKKLNPQLFCHGLAAGHILFPVRVCFF